MPFFTGVRLPDLGDFCCTDISGGVGKLVSFGEWLNGSGFTRYEHAEIYVGGISEEAPLGYTFGAYPGGAKMVPLDEHTLKTGLWSTNHFDISASTRDNIVECCKQLEGTPYSAADYFALVAHRFHIPAPLLKNYIASSKHMICSQLVDYVYMECGVHLFTDVRWPLYVTPADLAKILGG